MKRAPHRGATGAMRMRLVWIVLGVGLAVACNGSADEASSDGAELSSNTDSHRDTSESAVDSNSDGETSGTLTDEAQPESGDDVNQKDAAPSTPDERDTAAVDTQDDRQRDTVPSRNEPDGGPSAGGDGSAVADEHSDSSGGLPPGEAARIRCEAMDEQQCRDDEDDNCVPMRGARYSAQDACIEPRFVRCTCTATVSMECSSSCSDDLAIRYMQDDEDALWMFPTTCTPDEWREVAADDPMVSVFDDAAKCGGD